MARDSPDLVDRLATLVCLTLVLLVLLCAPLAGVGELRAHYGSRSLQRSGGIRELAFRDARMTMAAAPISSGPIAAAGRFACVDFVCVNRTAGVRNLLEYSPSTIASLRTYDSFASCVQSCVSSTAGRALEPALAATTARATASAHASPPPPPPPLPPPQKASSLPSPPERQLGYVTVGNQSLDDALVAWLDARHLKWCDPSAPVYFAPFSPNGIGNKLMAIVMAFHMSIMMVNACASPRECMRQPT